MGTEHNFLSAKLFLMVNQARPSSFTVSRGPFNVRAQGERGPPMLQQLRKSAKKAQCLKITQNVSLDPIFNFHIKIDMSGFQKQFTSIK